MCGRPGGGRSSRKAAICWRKTTPTAARRSRTAAITRLTRLGSPDILLIFGGTNDSWAGAEVGSYKYENQTREDLFTYRPALAKLLSEAQSRFPNVRILYLINTGLRKEITESTIEICKHYGVEYLQLKEIGKQSGHPNIAGMKSIASQVLAVLQP